MSVARPGHPAGESMLLCDEATASTSQKQNICACVAHELAHQWFGNLVTMQWWDDLWRGAPLLGKLFGPSLVFVCNCACVPVCLYAYAGANDRARACVCASVSLPFHGAWAVRCHYGISTSVFCLVACHMEVVT